MRVTVADDAEARERAHAATAVPAAKRQGANASYVMEEPGRRLDLAPRYCRCARPAPVAEVDRLHGVVSVGCLCCGRLRAELNRLDLPGAAVRRAALERERAVGVPCQAMCFTPGLRCCRAGLPQASSVVGGAGSCGARPGRTDLRGFLRRGHRHAAVNLVVGLLRLSSVPITAMGPLGILFQPSVPRTTRRESAHANGPRAHRRRVHRPRAITVCSLMLKCTAQRAETTIVQRASACAARSGSSSSAARSGQAG